MDLFGDDAKTLRKQPQGSHPEAIRAWDAAWLRTRGCRYAWQAKDAVLMAKALKLAEGRAELVAERIERLLGETEDQWIARNASPGLLVDRWNQLAYCPPKKPKSLPLPEYHPIPGPRIPPPSNLMQMLEEAKQRYARRLPKPVANEGS